MTDAVRIDDLAEPRFAPHVEEMLGAASDLAPLCEFTPDAVCRAASDRTGLDDFGADDFWERLGVLCRAYDEEAGLSDAGRVGIHGHLVQFAVNRLLVEDVWRRHPEVEEQEIRAPIVICGLPRTGTTHLHNLLAADPGLRYLPYWEAVEPVPLPGEPGGDPASDPRLERVQAALDLTGETIPYFERMHEMTLWHAHEEIHLLAVDFSSVFFETLAHVPSWRDYYLTHDQTPHYEYMTRVLKVLQHLRGGERWVLKSPQHLEQFGPLAAALPDATFVVTHRDPVAVVASLATMIAYTARVSTAPVDPVRIGHYWADRVDDFLRACVRDRAVLPASQSIDVRFDEFMADDVATVEAIYELAGCPFTDDVRAALRRYARDHPRGRHGGVVYDLADFDLDEAELRERFAPYRDRFAVPEEPLATP